MIQNSLINEKYSQQQAHTIDEKSENNIFYINQITSMYKQEEKKKTPGKIVKSYVVSAPEKVVWLNI